MPAVDPFKKALTRVTCARFVPPLLRAELEELGYEVQHEDHTAVDIGATLHECLDLVLSLRTAQHVMWMLKRFRCPSPKALYTEIAAFPWEELLPNDGYVTITSNVEHPKIDNSMYPNLVVKDAIVDRMTKVTGRRPDSGPDRTGAVIHLFWKGDRAWLYLNVNGERLGNRGYRKLPHDAPMRETLGAAVVLATGYTGDQPFVNPMCGSGTLAIEAALIATNRAPGLLRSDYAFRQTLLDLEDAWQDARARARKQTIKADPPPIVATDHDPRAIEASVRNATTAGVEHLIDFSVCDFSRTPVPEPAADETPGGVVILNPEYGLRLGEHDELEEIYRAIGDYFKNECGGYSGHVFTGNKSLAKRVGLKTASRTPFMNAQIECRLLSYELYAGTKKHPD